MVERRRLPGQPLDDVLIEARYAGRRCGQHLEVILAEYHPVPQCGRPRVSRRFASTTIADDV